VWETKERRGRMTRDRGNQGASNGREDVRAFVGVVTNYGGQMITAALAILAIVGAFVTFTIDKRNADPLFFVCISLSVVLLFSSTISGALGVVSVMSLLQSNVGAAPTTFPSYFNRQFYLLILGVVVLPISFFFFGDAKEDNLYRLSQDLQHQEDETQKLKEEVTMLKKDCTITRSTSEQ
jgi:hypothetical protein